MRRLVVVIACAPALARAEPIASTEQPTSEAPGRKTVSPASVPAEPTAADVKAAPLPGDESGRTDMTPGESPLRIAGRYALFVPGLVVEAALSPLHAAAWAQDHYQFDELYYSTFYNADRTIGLYPTVAYASGYGITAGVGFVDWDLAGAREHVVAHATTGLISGDAYHESLAAAVDTGHRLGRIQLGFESSFDRHPRDPYYGVGNDSVAVVARYRYQEARLASSADVRVVADLHLRVTGALTSHAFSRSDTGPPIDVTYPDGLTGWSGFDNAVGDAELRIDRRRRATVWETPGVHSVGWLAAGSLARVVQLGAAPDLWHATLEAQQFIRLTRGPRVLALRVRGEAVTGRLGDIPFSELPTLGGADFLRGYDFQRFRDRSSALVSAEYVWDVAHWIDAALFVDAGRVFPSLSDLDLHGTRVGYGAAFEISTDTTFLFETSISSSIDGGLFVNLSFNPVFDARARWR